MGLAGWGIDKAVVEACCSAYFFGWISLVREDMK